MRFVLCLLYVSDLHAYRRTLHRMSRSLGCKLEASLGSVLSKGSKEINVVEWTTRTALELIGQSGLGYSFDSFATENHPYAVAIKDLG